MPQIFPKALNPIGRIIVIGLPLLAASTGVAAAAFYRSSYATGVYEVPPQPVAFSHAHHVGGLGLDCRYCHTSVETSSFANVPPTKTCMNCHSQIWSTSPMLEPVRASFRTGQSIRWTRIHDLPDFVYFNHSIHVNKGVGCESCHGRVDKMPLTWAVASLQMDWCLDCHRHPEKVLRPQAFITTMGYQPPGDQEEIGRRLLGEYHIQDARVLTSCSTCHR